MLYLLMFAIIIEFGTLIQYYYKMLHSCHLVILILNLIISSILFSYILHNFN